MAAFIAQPIIEDLLQRTDLVALVDGYVPLKKRGNSYLACCPFHNEKTPSFYVIPKKQFYHCFGCKESGNAISFIMRHLNQSFVEAIHTLAMQHGMALPETSTPLQQTKNAYSLLAEVNTYYQQQLKKQASEAIQYLQSRGLNGETAKRFQLGYAHPSWHSLESAFLKDKSDLITTGMLIQKENGKTYDRFRNRIMFPIQDKQGRIIGFGGRALEKDQTPKYLNSPETMLFQKNRELYGLYQVLQQPRQMSDPILVVEGYLDVLALAQQGISNAVATLGTATSTFHIQLLAKYTKQILFCFDGDRAGKQALWRALESSLPHLHTGLDIGFIFLPDGEDPDSLIRKEGQASFMARISNPIPLHHFFLDTVSQNINLSTPAGITQLIQKVKPYLANLQDSVYKEYLLEDLARLTHIEGHRLQNLLATNITTVTKRQTPITRTPIRIAIALLLQHPEIYQICKDKITLQAFDTPKLKIIKTILEAIAESPEINTASLIELWRHTAIFDSINKLAAWDTQVPESALTKECLDTLLFLEKQEQDQKIKAMIEKSRRTGLSLEERMRLQTMLKIRLTD
jgi:DNA primase